MLPDYMRQLRRDNKEKSLDKEVRERFRSSRDALLESFSGFTREEKLMAMAELNELLLNNL